MVGNASSGNDATRKLCAHASRLAALATFYLREIPMISKDTLFALSLFPYLSFLWLLTRSGQAPFLALVGFYFTLVFVGVTIPAGIYTQINYGESLANVDWLHGAAESLLTVANILIVLGFQQAIRKVRHSSN
jgi:hypothetical protein